MKRPDPMKKHRSSFDVFLSTGRPGVNCVSRNEVIQSRFDGITVSVSFLSRVI